MGPQAHNRLQMSNHGGPLKSNPTRHSSWVYTRHDWLIPCHWWTNGAIENQDVSNYLFDIHSNDLFVIGSRVGRQKREVAIGGPCAARSAQLYCLYREVLFRQGKTRSNKLLRRLHKGTLPLDPYRYTDNIMGVICGSVSLSRLQKALHALYGLELQHKGEGKVLPSLEAMWTLDQATGKVDLRLKSKIDHSLPVWQRLSRFPDR